jgi:hypothetical protein
MAAILLADCEVRNQVVGEYKRILITTPATADSGDTVDISSLVRDGQLAGIPSRFSLTAGDEVTATYNAGTGVITLDAAGGTTNEQYVVELLVLPSGEAA